jgi:hypothetical protein
MLMLATYPIFDSRFRETILELGYSYTAYRPLIAKFALWGAGVAEGRGYRWC